MGNDDKVVELHQWYTVDELAEREGVSTRTIYRRLKRGDVEKRETEDGTRYRPATKTTDNGTDATDSHDTVTDVSSVSRSKGDGTDSTDRSGVSTDVTTDVSGVSELVALVREQHERIVELERENARLEADLEDLRAGDVDPAPEADDSTSRSAELVDALRETAASSETNT